MEDNKEVAMRQLRTNFDGFLVSDVEKYEVFKEKVELFFVCNPVPQEMKTALFLNGINDDVYKLIKDRLHPGKPLDKSLEELFRVLDEHYKVIVNVRSERFKFNCVQQERGEGMSEFVVRLREAATKCEFGSFINVKDRGQTAELRRLAYEDAMLDRFVMGLQNTQIQEKLLIDNPQSFEAAYSRAKTMQMALDEKQSSSTNDVNLVQYRNRYQRNSRAQRENSPSSINSSDEESKRRSSSREQVCSRCGYQTHYNGSCPAFNKSCTTCKKRGHFSRCCRKNQVDIIIGNILRSSEVFCLQLNIGEINTMAQVDTGACANLISPIFFSQLKGVSLEKDCNVLRNFSGHKLNVVGRVVLPVACASTSRRVEFMVVDTGRTYEPLLGRPGPVNRGI